MRANLTATREQNRWLQSDIRKKKISSFEKTVEVLGINCFDNRGQGLCRPDLLKFWLCDVVLPWLIPLLSKLRTMHSLILIVTAGNSSYLWFSDEETQAGGDVTQ